MSTVTIVIMLSGNHGNLSDDRGQVSGTTEKS